MWQHGGCGPHVVACDLDEPEPLERVEGQLSHSLAGQLRRGNEQRERCGGWRGRARAQRTDPRRQLREPIGARPRLERARMQPGIAQCAPDWIRFANVDHDARVSRGIIATTTRSGSTSM